MQVRFRCGSCSTSVQVDSSHAGKKAKCPKCGTVLQIPSMEKIAAAQAGRSGATPAKSASTAQAAPARPQPARKEIEGLSDFAPQFDADDFDIEPPPPLPDTSAPAPSLPAYYRPPERAESVSYAGFWKRLVAAMIDGFLFNIVMRIVAFVATLALGDIDLILIGVEAVAQWLYFAGMESSYYQATFGKQAMGIKVTDVKGQPISFGRASARYWAKLLSILSLGIGYIMIAFTPKKQGLHDMIAGCLVVNR